MFQQLAAAGFWPQNFELTSMIQVLVGGLLGLAVGIERSRRQKEAGKATHFVVGAASTLLTCISLWFKENGNYGDGARIAAQIVTGIGFLGAGMIFFRRESLRGLTTAAGIWATAAIGMCVATGMYWLAVSATALIIVVQMLLHSRLIKRNSQHLLYVKLHYDDNIKKKLMQFFGASNFHRFKVTAERTETEDGLLAETVIYPTQNCKADAIAQFMKDNPQIVSIERLEDL